MGCVWVRLALVMFFSFAIFINISAVPITRSSNLVHNSQMDDHEAIKTGFLENGEVESSADRRMEIEIADYPGSGANNRHTPRAQIAREERLH